MTAATTVASINDDADRAAARGHKYHQVATAADVFAWVGVCLLGAGLAAGNGWLPLPEPQVFAIWGLLLGPTMAGLRLLSQHLARRHYRDADELDALAERYAEAEEGDR